METPDTPHWTKTPEWGNLHDRLEGVHGNIHLKSFQLLFCLLYQYSFNIRPMEERAVFSFILFVLFCFHVGSI